MITLYGMTSPNVVKIIIALEELGLPHEHKAVDVFTGQQFDPAFLTHVEVTFAAEGPKLTRFTLEHRDIEKFGDKANEIWTAFDSDGGWGGMLNAFARLAEE